MQMSKSPIISGYEQYRMETYVQKQDNTNYLNDNMLQKINK